MIALCRWPQCNCNEHVHISVPEIAAFVNFVLPRARSASVAGYSALHLLIFASSSASVLAHTHVRLCIRIRIRIRAPTTSDYRPSSILCTRTSTLRCIVRQQSAARRNVLLQPTSTPLMKTDKKRSRKEKHRGRRCSANKIQFSNVSN